VIYTEHSPTADCNVTDRKSEDKKREARHLGLSPFDYLFPAMQTNPAYELLRQFASPVVAITSRSGDRPNGMISDSAIRASISPNTPRLGVYIHKWHLSHDMIWHSGRLCIHLLNQTNLPLVYQLGFHSGREHPEKLTPVPRRDGTLGLPVITTAHAAFELEVVNTMDVGYATHFLGDVRAFHPLVPGEILTAPWLRANLPPEWQDAFAENYRKAQAYIDSHSAIEPRTWSGPAGS
jgi:flavin reductase (DIM6/NTAB) family NADH-FMN oxidoreductase RutF